MALAAIFSAHSAYYNFWQKIPYFDVSRQKRVLFNCFATKQCLSMLKILSETPTLALTGSHCHSLAYSGPSGSLLLSNLAYTALNRLTGPLLGSQRRCHDDALSPALDIASHEIHRTIWYFCLWLNNVSFMFVNHVCCCTETQQQSIEKLNLSCKMENAWHQVSRKNQQSTVILMGVHNKKIRDTDCRGKIFCHGSRECCRWKAERAKVQKTWAFEVVALLHLAGSKCLVTQFLFCHVIQHHRHHGQRHHYKHSRGVSFW